MRLAILKDFVSLSNDQNRLEERLDLLQQWHENSTTAVYLAMLEAIQKSRSF
ncbi:hypothetical protein O9992_20235 [Vibrio lentus]|nr:hypothetical protein [Vibrio lentus]